MELSMETLAELDVEAKGIYYTSFDLSEPRLVHFSVRCDNGSGYFHLWDASGKRYSEFNNFHAIYSFYNASYNGQLPAGKYFVRMDNESAAKFFINLAKPQPLYLNEKGKASVTDTIHQPYQINAYSFRGKGGDGIHGILKKNGALAAPQDMELKYYKMSDAGSALYPATRSGKYYALDENYLYEAGIRLEGEYEDTLYVVVAYAPTSGSYQLIFHHADAAREITVDDDYAEYPLGPTASHIAAGYAVREQGAVTIANGTYTSMLPMKIDVD